MKKWKRFAQGAVLASAIFASSISAHAVMDFDDVPRTTQFYEPITWAGSAGLINGYGDGTFKPKATLTEAHFALMMARFIDADTLRNSKGNERELAYNVLKKKGIVLAGQTTKKAQSETFTRLQVAKAFYTYVEGKVPTDKQAIDWMYAYNISKGKGVSSDKYVDFGGSDPLKREHMAQFFKNLYTNWYFEKYVLKQSFQESELFVKDTVLQDPVVIDLNGDGVDELVVTYFTFDDPEFRQYLDRSFGYRYYGVYSFNDATNKWTHTDGDFLFTVGKDNGYTAEKVSMTGDSSEQLLMYARAYRSLTISAVTAKDLYDVKVSSSPLFAHENASWEIVNNRLVVKSSGSYSGNYAIENGKLVAKSLTQIPQQEKPDNAIVIDYEIKANGTLQSSYGYGDTIQAKVGQKIIFEQGMNNWYAKTARIMASGDDIFGKDDETLVAPGVMKIQIVPEEDWDNALTLYIQVTY